MSEIWKPIIETEGKYEISNWGNVRGVDRYARVCGNGRRLVKGKMIKPCRCTNGYLTLNASMGNKTLHLLIHRLVAQYFIPNPNKYPEVNHKDENPENNHVDNLEWCTPKYNCNYGTRNQRCMEKVIKKAVNQYTLDGEFVARYEMIKDAERKYGINSAQIVRVCKGKNRTAGGYIWKYA